MLVAAVLGAAVPLPAVPAQPQPMWTVRARPDGSGEVWKRQKGKAYRVVRVNRGVLPWDCTRAGRTCPPRPVRWPLVQTDVCLPLVITTTPNRQRFANHHRTVTLVYCTDGSVRPRTPITADYRLGVVV